MNKLMLVLVAALAIGCGKKAGNDAGAAIEKMREFKNEMCKCKDAKCAQDVSDRMSKWTHDQSKEGKSQPKFDEAQQKQASDLGKELGTCMGSAMMASTPPPPAGSDTATPAAGSAGSAATVAGLPKECDEYKAQVEKMKTCDKLPAAAKETLLKAYNDAVAGWASLPEGARSGLDVSCKRGTQALIDSVKEACGW
jgi:Sec-independent protein translocase protein TatA